LPAKKARTTTTKKKSGARRGPKKMTAAHKKAIANGRAENAVVEEYLGVLHRPKPRGRRPDVNALNRRRQKVRQALRQASGIERVLLAQEEIDLTSRIETYGAGGGSLTDAERAFTKVAASFSRRRGISYAAWRAAGVSPATLAKAGIKK
jgi:hypothetical protein